MYLLFRTTWHVIPYLVSNWIVNMNIEIIIPDSLSPDLNVLVQFCAKIAFAIFSFEMIDNKRRVNKLSNTVSSTSSTLPEYSALSYLVVQLITENINMKRLAKNEKMISTSQFWICVTVKENCKQHQKAIKSCGCHRSFSQAYQSQTFA